MKTFLAVHYPPVGMRNGLDLFLNAGAAGVATFDCGYPPRPNFFYATRFTIKSGKESIDNPSDFYSDPIGSARRWYVALQARWNLNPRANCRIINNELDIETPWHAEQQNKFYLEFMRVNDATTPHEKIGICSYAGCHPHN